MGWAGAGEIFTVVARGLLAAEANDELLDEICYELASKLTDQDWDTVDATVQEFKGHPVVQHALLKANGSMCLYDPSGRLDFYLEWDSRSDQWEMNEPQATVTIRRPGTVAGFNAILDAWAEIGGDESYRATAREHQLG